MKRKTIEEYIEVISILENEEGRAHTGRIASEMNIAPSSVTEMLQKLEKEDFLRYEAYSGAKLTSSGRDLAQELSRKHRTVAGFLEMLGVERAVADMDACQIEHHLSKESIERLEKYLEFIRDFPQYSKFMELFKRYCSEED